MRPAADSSNEQPIRFAGSVLKEKRHICGFFTTREEEYALLLPFIKEGFERGENAYHVVAPRLRGDHTRRLTEAGIDVEAAERDGQLKLCDWDEAYFPDGRFDQDRMVAMWEKALMDSAQDGAPLTRLVAHMEWALEDREGVSDLLEYEAKFDFMFQSCNCPVICTYDLTRHSGATIMDVLRTHPMVILGGLLQENPFYTPPQQFLQELRARRASYEGSAPTAN